MRNETTMFRLFQRIAEEDERILALYMNGSRTNKNVEKDIFQDYDIVYVVRETKSFIGDPHWLEQFGTVMYMQYPDENPLYPSDKENFYGWLIQFTDGVRVDMHVESVEHAAENIKNDRLCKVLLDKEHVLPKIPEASDSGYWVKRPAEGEFLACSNEFWWCSNNLAKGLWREEIPYAQDMANFVVRKELEKMLSWKVGTETGFSVSVGKSAKYLKRWLPDEYRRYLGTYFGGDVEEAWDAVMAMCSLFEETALCVAERLGFEYNLEEGKAARAFLEHVRALPKDASEIYPDGEESV